MKLEPLQTDTWVPLAKDLQSVELLNSMLRSDPLNPEGVDQFAQTFGLESLAFLSFDHLNMLDDSMLEERGIITLLENKSKLRVNEIILDVLEEPLKNCGYTLLPTAQGGYNEDRVIFFKMIDSYQYRILLSKNGDLFSKWIKLHYAPPYNNYETYIWLNENGYEPIFPYNNESELRTSLLEILRHIEMKGIPWLESQRIESINVEAVYENVLNPYLNKHGFFLRKEVGIGRDDNYSSEFIYQTMDEKWRILFRHGKVFPKVYIYMKRYNELIDATLHDPESNISISGGIFSYKTSHELGEQLLVAAKGFIYLMQYEATLRFRTNQEGPQF